MVLVETPLKEHAPLISKDWQCEEAILLESWTVCWFRSCANGYYKTYFYL